MDSFHAPSGLIDPAQISSFDNSSKRFAGIPKNIRFDADSFFEKNENPNASANSDRHQQQILYSSLPHASMIGSGSLPILPEIFATIAATQASSTICLDSSASAAISRVVIR